MGDEPGQAIDCKEHGLAIVRLEGRVEALEKDVRFGHKRISDSVDELKTVVTGLADGVSDFKVWRARLEGMTTGAGMTGRLVWMLVGGSAGAVALKAIEHFVK